MKIVITEAQFNALIEAGGHAIAVLLVSEWDRDKKHAADLRSLLLDIIAHSERIHPDAGSN